MASLKEYFIKDGARNLTLDEKWPLSNQSGHTYGEITARLHFDFEAYARYVSFFIPEMDGVELPEAFALREIPKLLKAPSERVQVQMGIGRERTDGKDLVFTGQVYLYSERPVKDEHKERLMREAATVGHRIIFRSVEYMNERNRYEKPLAFISHDSRDKKGIAEPLAIQLQKMMCPVWFDQYSLQVGDSLRRSIEKGLQECPKCVVILTQNFLNNSGWTRVEYDSIFTRELVERRRVILPVRHNVTTADIYKYSPILADRVAAQWSDGVEEVARKLFRAIEAPST
jgi:TIR domain